MVLMVCSNGAEKADIKLRPTTLNHEVLKRGRITPSVFRVNLFILT